MLPVDSDPVRDFIAAERLPASYIRVVREALLPLAEHISSAAQGRPTTLIQGICGGQGTGKSTMCAGLELLLSDDFRVMTLSLDDFYLDRPSRRELSLRVHPLMQTRGVPGTHNVALLDSVLSSLVQGDAVKLPRFDKAIDNPLPELEWQLFDDKPDIILLEGWCVGAPAQMEEQLREPINELERIEDPDGMWRGYVNDCLLGDYRDLFARIDQLALLCPPSFNAVYRWRLEQEEKLGLNCGQRFLSNEGVARFIQHFERLSRHCMEQLPYTAECCIQLAEDHGVSSVRME